jgi:inorganic pyrophosphatase
MENLVNGTDFWKQLDRFVASRRIVIDRPKGSVHPRYPDLCYPLDYGYLEGVPSSDGGDLDVWKGTAPELRVEGMLCTFDQLKLDLELKLLVSCTADEMATAWRVQNEGAMRAVLVPRGGVFPWGDSSV